MGKFLLFSVENAGTIDELGLFNGVNVGTIDVPGELNVLKLGYMDELVVSCGAYPEGVGKLVPCCVYGGDIGIIMPFSDEYTEGIKAFVVL